MSKRIESMHRNRGVAEVKLYDGPSKDRYQFGVVRLDFNERTTPPHKLVSEALIKWAKEGEHQLYPPDYKEVEGVIAKYAGVKPEEVILTNGSDGGISLLSRTILEKGDKIVIPKPTFPSLEDEPRKQRAEIVSPRPSYMGENLDFPFEEVMTQLASDIKLVVICNPNSPTGTIAPRGQLIEIIKRAAEVKADVLVDEAYYEFSKFTVIDLIREFDNLYISRTLSKAMGIAGLRAGYIVSQKENRDELEKFRQPYEVNAFAVAAVKTLESPEVLKDIKNYVSEVMDVSKPILEEFYEKNGIKFFPSAANFHLLQTEKGLAEFLKSKGIFVRVKESLPGLVRVSIGTKEDTKKYIRAFQEYLDSSK